MILRVTRLLGTTQQDSTLLPTISGLRLFQERLPPMGTSMSQKDLESVLSLDHSPRDSPRDVVLVDPIVLFSGTFPSLKADFTPQKGIIRRPCCDGDFVGWHMRIHEELETAS